jgi:hypothetical protein
LHFSAPYRSFLIMIAEESPSLAFSIPDAQSKPHTSWLSRGGQKAPRHSPNINASELRQTISSFARENQEGRKELAYQIEPGLLEVQPCILDVLLRFDHHLRLGGLLQRQELLSHAVIMVARLVEVLASVLPQQIPILCNVSNMKLLKLGESPSFTNFVYRNSTLRASSVHCFQDRVG